MDADGTSNASAGTSAPAWSFGAWVGLSGFVSAIVGILVGGGVAKAASELVPGAIVTGSATLLGIAVGIAVLSVLIAIGMVLSRLERPHASAG